MYLKTNQFHVKQFTYLMQRLKDIDEGGTSLFDNSILLFMSSLFDGDAHGADQLPIVLGRRSRRSAQRRTGARFPRQRQRQPPRLQPVPLDHGPMGVKLDRFGDTDKRLPDLFA